jgi:glycosyltransferase involved in cell wall biosynthesis
MEYHKSGGKPAMKNVVRPLVSVLINNFNYAKFVVAAVESVLEQSYENIEVIVVDDGSTDRSLELLRGYEDRVRLIAKSNGGQASAFNAGFVASNGEIVCLLDADDLFKKDKVARLVETFGSYAEIGWVFDQLTRVEDKGTGELVVTALPARVPDHAWGLWDVRERVAVGKMPYIPCATSGLSFRRELLSSILPMSDSIRITSDNYVKFCALAFSSGLMLEDSLTLQRIHGSNAYTHDREDKAAVANRIAVLTGMALYRKSPSLRRFGLGMFRACLGRLTSSNQLDAATRCEVEHFLRSLALPKRTALVVRVACHALKMRLSMS